MTTPNEKTTTGKCEDCGKENSPYIPNSYLDEVWGEIKMQYLCDICAQESRDAV